jgi:tRNA 2-thiocytidine biosynthesis protein TtcA
METPDSSRLAYWLLKDFNKAIRDYDMIQDGDRVAVAVSGGKDSLSLLRLLDIRRRTSPEKYSLFAIHILGDSRGWTQNHPDLTDWLDSSGYDFAAQTIILPPGEKLPMNCHRCTRNRRRTLFEIAYRHGCNKIAMGHHADDLAQTTLLNLFNSGNVETMAPKSTYFNGTFYLIRPMSYLFENEIKRYAAAQMFPTPPPECPQKHDSNRQRVKLLIKQSEKWSKDLRSNLLRAGLNGINPRF